MNDQKNLNGRSNFNLVIRYKPNTPSAQKTDPDDGKFNSRDNVPQLKNGIAPPNAGTDSKSQHRKVSKNWASMPIHCSSHLAFTERFPPPSQNALMATTIQWEIYFPIPCLLCFCFPIIERRNPGVRKPLIGSSFYDLSFRREWNLSIKLNYIGLHWRHPVGFFVFLFLCRRSCPLSCRKLWRCKTNFFFPSGMVMAFVSEGTDGLNSAMVFMLYDEVSCDIHVESCHEP